MKQYTPPHDIQTLPITKKSWESPCIVMEYSLVVQAQDPLPDKTDPNDPFLGPLSTSGT